MDAKGRPDVKWGASAGWRWARCRKCNRQNKLCEGAPGSNDERAKTKDAFVGDLCDVVWTGTELDTTEMSIDSGCRRSVAGRDWHERLQSHLSEIGLHAFKRQSNDKFRYGDGKVVEGTCSWTYPVSIRGHQGQLDIAEVPVETPPRASRQLMKDLGLIVGFAEDRMDIRKLGLIGLPSKKS